MLPKYRKSDGIKGEINRNCKPLQILRGPSDCLKKANWVLLEGSPAYETDTHKLKIGDGVTKYNALPYIGSASNENLAYDIWIGLGNTGTESEFWTKLSTIASINNKEDVLDKLSVTDDGKLLFDGQPIGSAGGGSGTYTDSEGSMVALGGWKVGEKANEMNLQDFAYKLLHPYTAPNVSLNINPGVLLYDKVNSSISSITLKASVVKKSNEIKEVKFYSNNILIHSASDVENGGNFTYLYKPDTPIKSNTTFKVSVNDGNKTVDNTITIKFVNKTYYGVINDGELITEVLLKSLTSVLKDTVKSSCKFTASGQKFVYATPIGTVKSITDGNGFEYLDTFVHNTITMNGETYHVYAQDTPSFVTDFIFNIS